MNWLVALAIAAAAPLGQTPDPVGTVLDVQGQWILEGKPPVTLERGTPLPSGGRIRPPQTPKPGDRLLGALVPDADSTQTLRVNCDTRGACSRNVQLPTLPPSSLASSVFRHVREAFVLMFRDKALLASTMARADDGPRDAVVRVESGAVDLTPAVAELPNQQYIARFSPVEPPGDSTKPVESAAFMPGRSQSVRARDLRPGLYRLELVVAGEYTRAGADAWVYAAEASRFESATDAFKRASRTADGWRDAVDVSTRRAFLRAFLLSLARDPSLRR